MKSELETDPVSEREPTADDLAGMKWWNDMTVAERAKALEAAGWKSGDTWTPSAADAWAFHKKRTQAGKILPFTKKPEP